MALNKYMHPRNRYRTMKPNFKELAAKYDFFREVTTEDEQGRISIDFKVPGHLAALSKALLLEDFALNVEFPLDRLVPTVPLRLNYILWLEDIIKSFIKPNDQVVILDVGVGASCIYPLLGARQNGWRFVGTDIDARNLAIARENIQRNGLESLIKVIQVKEGVSSLDAVLSETSSGEPYLSAVMANPPFFCNSSDAVGTVTDRSITRPTAKTVSSAARHECQTQGGEIFFAMRLARDSVKYATRVGFFSVMLGKKTSVVPLKRILRKLNIPKVSVYELCQGRIMRWGVAWTFQPNIQFPVSEFRRQRKLEKPPLRLELPPSVSCLSTYSVEALLEWLRNEFKQLKMKVLDQKNKAEIGGIHLSISATENTWTHNRRKRREAARQAKVETNDSLSGATSVDPTDPLNMGEANSHGSSMEDTPPSMKRTLDSIDKYTENNTEPALSSPTAAKRAKFSDMCEEGDAWEEDDACQPFDPVTSTSQSNSIPPLIQADVYVDQVAGDSSPTLNSGADDAADDLVDFSSCGPLVIKIAFTGGTCREAANQIICYLKNRLR